MAQDSSFSPKSSNPRNLRIIRSSTSFGVANDLYVIKNILQYSVSNNINQISEFFSK